MSRYEMCTATDVLRHFGIMCFRCCLWQECEKVFAVHPFICSQVPYILVIYIYLWYKYLLLKNDHSFLQSKIRLYSPELELCKQLLSLRSSACLRESPLPSPKQLFLIVDICPWSIREISIMTYNILQQMNNKKEKSNFSL